MKRTRQNIILLACAMLCTTSALAQKLGIPDTPIERHMSDNGTSITYTWEAAKNTNSKGEPIVPAEVEYVIAEVQRNPLGSIVSMTEKCRVKGKSSITIDYPCDEGDPHMLDYVLYAMNEAGQSEPISVAHIVGKPATLPILESFADGNTHYFLWTQLNGQDNWYLSNEYSCDDDENALAINIRTAGQWGAYCTGKISLANNDQPKLVFSYLSKPGSDITIEALAYKPDGNELTIFSNTLLHVRDDSWQLAYVDLTSVKNERYVILKLKVTSNTTDTPVFIDDIRILNVPTKDIALTINAPETAKKGQNTFINVIAENWGHEEVLTYQINLYADNKLIETRDGAWLFNFQKIPHQFTLPISAINTNSEMTVRAEVVCDGDVVSDNNTAEATLKLNAPTAPMPTGLVKDGNKLSWQAPASTDVTLTESFEDYAPWTFDDFEIAPWSIYNGDDGYTGILNQTVRYRLQDKQLAYFVFSPDEWYDAATLDIPCLKPHTGSKYTASVYQVVEPIVLSARSEMDDWLISPVLTGKAQTISFWVKPGYIVIKQSATSSLFLIFIEEFDLLYSTTGTDVADFQKLGESYQIGNIGTDLNMTNDVSLEPDWTEFKVDLPEGAKYFAIRHNTTPAADGSKGYIFMLDDITYTTTYGEPVGYNIYRDDELLKNVGETTYSDETLGEHNYAVTAVYADGKESAPISTDPAGISIVRQHQAPTDIYTLDGRCVDRKDLKAGLYIMGNRKMIIK